MRYRYYICDVFTETRFGGNQLAVLPEAEGLSDRQMQQIAREFNFSESTFVFPGRTGSDRTVRIFTPTQEVPFAGHPNIGTSFVLAADGAFGSIEESITIAFDEKAGPVPITIRRRADGGLWTELSAPQPLDLGPAAPVEAVANALSLPAAEIVTGNHPPEVASVGLPFLMVELRSRAALQSARINLEGFEALRAQGLIPDVHLYVRSSDEFDLRARMFAPFDGVPEDPATGSANCALAGLLAHLDERPDGVFQWRIAQGVEIGRPSILEATAEKRGGAVVQTRIGGASVLIAEGVIELD